MKLIIQRVKESSVEIDGKIKGKISKGLNILVAGSYSTSIDGTPVAVSQSVEPGTEVPEGTVVEVEFRYYENIDG